MMRFWGKVDRRGPDECWPWLAGKWEGYGRFWIDGRTTSAHRVAYELTFGPISPGMQIDHVAARGCTRRDCVNPAHLEEVTLGENVARGRSANGAKTHCAKGHVFKGENLIELARGGRMCRTCKRDADARRRISCKPAAVAA